MRIDRRQAFASYTSSDLARSGFVGAVWTVFYILLAIHAGYALKLRTDAAVAVACIEGGGSFGDVALRPNR